MHVPTFTHLRLHRKKKDKKGHKKEELVAAEAPPRALDDLKSPYLWERGRSWGTREGEASEKMPLN